MEKTVLYSKKSTFSQFNLKEYESCEHVHCQKLLSHIKFLNNTLTEKVLKENLHSSRLKDSLKQNKFNLQPTRPSNSLLRDKGCRQEIQTIKKNYTRLKALLQKLEAQNDQLLEENQSLCEKSTKLQDKLARIESATHKEHSSFEYSITSKCNETQNQETDYKTSLFNQTVAISVIQAETIESSKIKYQGQRNFGREEIDELKFESGQRGFPMSIQKQLLSTDRSEIFNKYNQIMRQNNQLTRQNNKQKILINEFTVNLKRITAKYQGSVLENDRLKRIIKIRGQIQKVRNQSINQLKRVLDQIEGV